MSYQTDSINWQDVTVFDRFLDEHTGSQYQKEPLAQDWARISKVIEEAGEAVQKFILLTGQNPRKGYDGAIVDVLDELADTAFTAIYAIQHFTKNDSDTRAILRRHQHKARGYIRQSIARDNQPA